MPTFPPADAGVELLVLDAILSRVAAEAHQRALGSITLLVYGREKNISWIMINFYS